MVRDWVSAQEAAEQLGVARDTMYRWLADGKIPHCYRVGALWRVPVVALSQMMKVRDARDAAAAAEPAPAKYAVGDCVMVVGIVRGVVATAAGKTRYVVEVDGVLHAHKENQLQLAVNDADRATRTPTQTS